jgi:hypothetical protein
MRLRRVSATLVAGLFIVLVAAVAAPRPAKACTCAADQTEAQYLASSDVAFDGTAVAVSRGQTANTWTFRMDNSVKGNPSNPQDVISSKDSASCGMDFDLGTAYRIYAKKGEDGTMTTGLCSGDRPTSAPPATGPVPTSVLTSTTRAAATASTTSMPMSASPSTVAAPATVVTLSLDTTTEPFADLTTRADNNVALKIQDSGNHTNRFVIGAILAAAVAAVGAGVVLWRRGP